MQEERHAHELLEEEDRPAYVPRAFDAMRRVPAYEGFIKERFERCLDLYLCPRALKKRAFVKDPQTLLPKLPKPQELQPFPTTLLIRFLGHTGPVCINSVVYQDLEHALDKYMFSSNRSTMVDYSLNQSSPVSFDANSFEHSTQSAAPRNGRESKSVSCLGARQVHDLTCQQGASTGHAEEHQKGFHATLYRSGMPAGAIRCAGPKRAVAGLWLGRRHAPAVGGGHGAVHQDLGPPDASQIPGLVPQPGALPALSCGRETCAASECRCRSHPPLCLPAGLRIVLVPKRSFRRLCLKDVSEDVTWALQLQHHASMLTWLH